MKNQSFNLPLKIKIDPKMAPIREKNELAKIQNASEIRQEHLLSQDMRATPIKTTRSFINQFSNSDRKARKPHEEHVD